MRHAEVPADVNEATRATLEAAFAVHTALGPGLLERVYVACLAHELAKRGRRVLSEVHAPVVYNDVRIDLGYRMDLVVDERVVVEVKAVERLIPIHYAQLLTYLRVSGVRVGLLFNFHEPHLKDGIHRLVAG